MKEKIQLGRLLAMFLLMFTVSFVAVAQDDTDGAEDDTEEGPCPNRYGDDEEEAKKNLSLFNQYIQTKEYHKAYKYYRYLLVHAPCVQKRVLYSGAVVVKAKMADLGANDIEAYKARYKGLRDTLFMSYAKRIEYWGQEGYVKGKWANDIATYDAKRMDEALQMFKESLESEGYNTDDKVPAWYMNAAANAVKKEVIPKDSLFPIYFTLMDIIMYNKAQGTGDQQGWITSENYVNTVMKPHLKCDALEEFFKPRIEANPDDINLKKNVVDLMTEAKCSSSDFYLSVAEEVIAIEPSANAYISLAKAYLVKKNKAKAKELLLKAAGMMDDSDSAKADVYESLMTIEYSLSNWAKVREYAYKVLAMDPNNGKALLELGSAYAATVSSCTSDNIDGLSILWVAYDYAAQAAAADPSVKDDAQKLMANLRSKFVTKSSAFFNGFTAEEGSSFTVPCVNKVTTVRYRPE